MKENEKLSDAQTRSLTDNEMDGVAGGTGHSRPGDSAFMFRGSPKAKKPTGSAEPQDVPPIFPPKQP